MTDTSHELLEKIQMLNYIGIALSAEHNTRMLMQMILQGAKSITHADGGTLYTVTDDQHLKFEIIITDSLELSMGVEGDAEMPFPPIPLYLPDGRPNNHLVAAYAVLNDRVINIPDAYQTEDFDFSGTRKFDDRMAYHSQSFLTIPMKNHRGEIIGVLQLLNKMHPQEGIIPFTEEDERLVSSLASQAAVALTNKELIDELKKLFEAFIQLIASAIDEKSPYTGGHCRRVPELTMLLAKAAAAKQEGPMKDFDMSENDYYELEIAAWLHDCGKITTPEYVVDKATKLETIFDRMDLVETRFELKKRDLEIAHLKSQLQGEEHAAQHEQQLQIQLDSLSDDLEFIRRANKGAEFMSAADKQRIQEIAQRHELNIAGRSMALLTENEVKNLCIARGTLTDEERGVINHHITATIKMLNSLPFPRHLRKVPEYAGGHHERMDGKGYPNGLEREQMSVQARVMAIADIFEALTAADRPYKPAKPLSESLSILGKMMLDQHIDPDLFNIFIKDKVYLSYAEKFLRPDQLDMQEPEDIPGYPFN